MPNHFPTRDLAFLAVPTARVAYSLRLRDQACDVVDTLLGDASDNFIKLKMSVLSTVHDCIPDQLSSLLRVRACVNSHSSLSGEWT